MEKGFTISNNKLKSAEPNATSSTKQNTAEQNNGKTISKIGYSCTSYIYFTIAIIIASMLNLLDTSKRK